METFEVVDALTASDIAVARALIQEYAATLGGNLDYQNLSHELEHLDEMYAPPSGALLLARRGDEAVGCVAFRPFDHDTCEMKRLYVRPGFRGLAVGRALARTAIGRACARGYRRIVLDTLATMGEARELYTSLGFRETAPYNRAPIGGIVYMELEVMSGR